MENKKSHYFYVLLCQDGSFYGGYTTEPERRLTEHNSGTGAKYTRLAKRRPVIMIHTENLKHVARPPKPKPPLKINA